ncbi:hypothetical protein HanPSC8_Chr00c062g0803991 [Helianthus annuus]|nr:hypothetical protein HanPSC8_Chr00c062g0803991 [Helianthus annuus]
MQNEQVMRVLLLKWGAGLGTTVAYGAHRRLRWVLKLFFCHRAVPSHRSHFKGHRRLRQPS